MTDKMHPLFRQLCRIIIPSKEDTDAYFQVRDDLADLGPVTNRDYEEANEINERIEAQRRK